MDTFAERKLGNLVRFANQIPNKSFRQPFPESDSAQPNQIHELASPFLRDRSLGRRECLEPLVGNRFAADDRAAVRSRCQALLGSGDGRQLFAEILGAALVELVLKEIRREVRRVGVVGQFAVVLVAEMAELFFDPTPLGGQQLARLFSVHGASLRRQVPPPLATRRGPGCVSRALS